MSVLLNALREVYKSNIAVAKAKIQIYLDNPVGVGDHSTLTETINEQVGIIADSEDRLRALEKYYLDKLSLKEIREDFPTK